jgi:hypothetical protein
MDFWVHPQPLQQQQQELVLVCQVLLLTVLLLRSSFSCWLSLPVSLSMFQGWASNKSGSSNDWRWCSMYGQGHRRHCHSSSSSSSGGH